MTSAPPPEALNTGEPVLLTDSGGTVVLVEGGTFCLSNRAGDIEAGTAHGLFFRDTRLLSTWRLRLDGHSPDPLSTLTPETFAAQFIQRRVPKAGLADSTLLVVRDRLVGDGLRETIRLDNLGREPSAVTLVLEVGADFADLFAVKEGRAPSGGADAAVDGAELLLTDRFDRSRGLVVTTSAHPLVMPGSLSWRIVVPAGRSWQTEIVATPTLDGHRVEPQFHRGQQVEHSGPARKIRAWRSASTVITADDPLLTQVLRRTERDLGALQIHDPARGGRPYVAAGAPWFMTLFGRDSLLTAWMALPLDVGLAVGTLQRLAETQGHRLDPITEEQPGRILHELRVGPASAQVLGSTHYSGTIDATPLFVMLLTECWRWGADPAAVRALLPAADAALAWIDDYGDRDGDGFVEYQRATDRGLINQGWKDSVDGITDAAGHTATPPIALCEVQGYVYAAWLARAELAEAFGDPATAARLRTRAAELRARFAEAYWLPDLGWYAVALDGHKRPVDSLTSNAAHCLWTGIATDDHAAILIDRLADHTMDTGFGLRTLAATMGAYNPMSYHNGSVWPHDTAIAVAGLLAYHHVAGAVELAERLATGLLDAAAVFGARLPELFCGFSRTQFNPPVPYPTSCSPQAWASAAPLLLIRSFLDLHPHVPHRTLTVRPTIPARWGTLTLQNLRLSEATIHITAEHHTITIHGLPDNWKLITTNEIP